ncbi:carbohydrate ABC transporter permease [Paenibacillus periandrae]|uniref:carbohydrate ABC transporter permease n=1 Tax=Paenibacillus periandrae TaxID=1761741 RepID=UPI001F09A3B7|nr:carbohydrate ABC transporter permease [Paenibacillus periandrae]
MKGLHAPRWFSVINYILLTLFALVTLLPFLYLFLVSFTDAHEYATSRLVIIPREWSLDSYRYILSTRMFMRSIGVSGLLALAGSAISILVSSGLAYALSRNRLSGRRIALAAILFTMMFHPGMIPNFLLVKQLGLMNTLWALILPQLTSAWYIILMKGFLQTVPDELEEAGRIDGCSDFRIFFRIYLPIALPSMAAFALFYAVQYWNTYFAGVLYISSESLRPMQVVLQMMLINSSTNVADPGIAAVLQSEQQLPPETIKMAAVVVSTVPILLVYPFLQKYFVSGMMVGSVKG